MNKEQDKRYRNGELHPSWKGDNVCYTAFHHWIKSVLGRPMKCDLCGIKNLNPRSYNWSNKDHKYRRVVSDWQRLCVSCHKKFDLLFIHKKFKAKCKLCGIIYETKSKKSKFCCKKHWTEYNYPKKKNKLPLIRDKKGRYIKLIESNF